MSTRTFDERTEKNLATLLPAVVPTFRAFLARANDALNAQGITVKVISGNRNEQEQTALYAQGRTKPGPIVTYAKAGSSNHNFKIAADIGLFRGKDYLEDSPLYETLGAVGKAVGLAWGGDWRGKARDLPHWEYPTGLTMAQKRDRVAKGIPLVHVTEPAPSPATRVWSVEYDGEQIISHCLDTASVRAVVERVYGGTLAVDDARKVITIQRAR